MCRFTLLYIVCIISLVILPSAQQNVVNVTSSQQEQVERLSNVTKNIENLKKDLETQNLTAEEIGKQLLTALNESLNLNSTDGENDEDEMFINFANLYDQEIEEEWSKYLTAYNPESYTRFKIPGQKKEVFIEMIDEPCLIRGLVYADARPIQFYVTNQNDDKLFEKLNKSIVIFSFNVSQIGQYYFHIVNNYTKPQLIHFSVDVSNLGENVNNEDLDPLEFELTQFTSTLGEYLYQTQFTHKRYESYNEKINNTHSNLLLLTIIETLIIIATTIWQIYYIKKIVDHRSII